AERTTATQRDPRPQKTPIMCCVTTPRNGQLDIYIDNPQPGQVLERITAASGERRDIQRDATGSTRLTDTDVSDGATYCYRLFVVNQWGARYSNIKCATTTTDPPDWPHNLRVSGRDGTIVGLDWDDAHNADSYELHYDGTRPGYVGRDGNKTTS